MSPTARTLAELRRLGFVCDVVERWIPRARVRKDWGGWGDVLGVGQGVTLLVQTTDGSHVAARVTKARALPSLVAWLAVPSNRAEVWGWTLAGPRGARKVWTLRRVDLGFDLCEAIQ